MAHFQPEPCRTAYRLADSQSVLRLELQENAELVSGAISAYILSNIESLQDESDRAYVEQVLRVKAEATLLGLGVLSEIPDKVVKSTGRVEQIVKKSGSFLIARDYSIYFVHQSAKDCLIGKGDLSVFPSGSAVTHRCMFTQSLQIMKKVLRRDMYSLGALGTPINQAQPPEPDLLAFARYLCVYWVNH
ncbi:Vegetative incompatibility protein HET-E-1 [Penicillium cosmopolitanum]|uniref:Vegetative incompatibility protein HET-E-1 n=1 Tax=Penicillium cosmopolitanum TaxID=1131564 RepID=A0A9W9SI72_9EURO|nr:Vegetative incompatibility protein HET-E-1 [Penicillium cosmopolitanum]KAJ5378465.1 Vegetative incompatibility protein HET-E-1 [Penicillium cosmopolitanum]